MFGDIAYLEVSFWSVDSENPLFYTEQGGTIRSGITLKHDIYRQASESVHQQV